MHAIVIEGTSTTPSVRFDAKKGTLDIKGRSIEEGSVEFYAPLIRHIDEYAKSPAELTHINIHLEYMNTSSSRGLIEVLKRLDVIHLHGSKVMLTWFYEEDDEEMLEAGEDLLKLVDIPFTMHPIKTEE